MSFIQAFNVLINKFNGRAQRENYDHPETAVDLTKNVPSDPVLLAQLAVVLTAASIDFEMTATHLQMPEGLVFAVQKLETIALGEGRVRTCTKIHAWHSVYFPQGIAEYQHALAATEEAALIDGFKQWANMDLPVLQDATRDMPLHCTVIEMNTAADEVTATANYRQVILGPVAHLASLPAPKKKDDHPFCPCCLFTESMNAFHDVLQRDQFLGVRLFASRDSQGVSAADCRINGEDFPAAIEPLVKYVEQWPQRGLEFRKQFIVIRSVSRSLETANKLPMPVPH
ncbi:DUF6348 family protein [Undibacterium sp. RuRC25W]|uniref:DUF6348 family protein n=1 Tax=Undibacterium sp. RuRC25W TaxID=3413047 RepID=UPI003BF206FC